MSKVISKKTKSYKQTFLIFYATWNHKIWRKQKHKHFVRVQALKTQDSVEI